MKRILLSAVFLSFLIPIVLQAQPQIAYIIPDVGTPGMMTYVEVISPYTLLGKFGSQDFIYTTRNNTTIELVNPADTNRVIISPVVVSWTGRLISCMFFVKPGAALGPVPIRVLDSAQSNPAYRRSNVDTFFIVAPQTFGTKSGGGVIGSGGAMGTRSKRGAMIVDSMILNSGNYTISTSDPDAIKAGNQGFLPCIIISKGTLAVNSGATIAVDANGKHGGPGGGGGGGYGNSRVSSPSIPGEADGPLGDGYAAGRALIATVFTVNISSPGGSGTGSGANGYGLSGVGDTSAFSTSRLYGSGIGHPFDQDGRSGGAAALGTPPASFFGLYYGGGGNATTGQGSIPAAAASVGGQVIGNMQVVPLHGGGGGASGGSCDSVGGGGGGGLAIYSMWKTTVAAVSAKGGNGKNGSASGTSACSTTPPRGDGSGGGAGGCVIIGGKLGITVTSGTVDVSGGTSGSVSGTPGSTSAGGGVGRFRNDGRLIGSTSLTVTSSASRYAGPTLDTITFADSIQWTLRGTGIYRGGSDSVTVYIRGQSTGNIWNAFSGAIANDSTWTARVAFPVDSMAYICVVQRSTSGDTTGMTTATKVPLFIMSQMSGSIVRLNLVPKLAATATRNFGTLKCAGFVYDTLVVKDTGTAPLIIKTGSTFTGGAFTAYGLISPTLPDTIQPGDSVRFIYRIDPSLVPNNTSLNTTLRLLTNDGAKTTWDIAITAFKALHQYAITTSGPVAKTVDFGSFYLGSFSSGTPPGTPPTVTYKNLNTYNDAITAITLVGTMPKNVTVVPPNAPLNVNANDSVALNFKIYPQDTGSFNVRFILTIAPCGDTVSVYVKGHIRSAIITTPYLKNNAPTWEITGLACGDTAIQSFAIRSTGNDTLWVAYPTITGLDRTKFTILSPDPSTFPRRLPRGDSVVFTMKVVANAGIAVATLFFQNNDSTRDQGNVKKDPYGVQVQAVRDDSKLDVTDSLLDFGSVCVGDQFAKDITLINNSLQTVITINSVTKSGISTDYQVSPGSYPLDMQTSGRISLSVTFAPTTTGTFYDTVVVRSQPCNRFVRVILKGIGIRAKAVAPATLSFGQQPVNRAIQQIVYLVNPNNVPITVDQIVIQPANPQLRIISPIVPPTTNIPAKDSIPVVVEYKASGVQKLPAISLCAHTSAPCVDNMCIALDGEGINASVALTKTKLTMNIPACTASNVREDSLIIQNIGVAPLDVTSIVANPASFTVVSPLPTNFTLTPNGSQIIIVRYTAASAGTTNGKLSFTTSDVNRPSFDIDLSGHKDSASFGVTVNRQIDFGTVYSTCGSRPSQTFRVRNAGTVPDTINGFTNLAPNYITSPPLPIIVQPGTDSAITVTFATSTSGTYNQTMQIQGLPCLIDSIVLKGTFVDIQRSVANTGFGQVTIGSSSQAVARVTNASTTALRIVGAVVIPPTVTDVTVTPGQFPMIVPGSNGTADVKLDYAPTATGTIPANTKVMILFDSPCPDTLYADISGQAVTAGVLLSKNDIQFGKVLNCLKPFDTLIIGNSGNIPLTVNGITLNPATATAYTFSPSLATYTGKIILPNAFDTLRIGFDPSVGPDGLRNATIDIATNDPQKPTVTVNIGGERISESLAINANSFPPTNIGSSSNQSFTITNNGTTSMLISGITIPPPFTLVSTTPPLNTTLAPGQTLVVNVQFTPTKAGNIVDTMRITASTQCGPQGFAIVGLVNVSVSATATWKDISGKPGDIIRIPLELNQDVSQAAITGYSIETQWNKTMLIPLSIIVDGTLSNGYQISSQQLTPGDVRFTANGTTPLAGPGVLAYIEAKVALGDSLTTTIRPGSGSQFLSQNASLSVSSGTFTLIGYCQSGGDRLVSTNGNFGLKTVKPNPVANIAQVDFDLLEQGRATVVLRNAIGNVVATYINQDLKPGPYTLNVSTEDLPSGVYYLELRAQDHADSKKVLIVK